MTQKGQIVGYVRVSSADQNLARQLAAIGAWVKSAGVVYEVDPSVGRVGQAVRA